MRTDDFLSSFETGIRLTVKARPGSSRAKEAHIIDVADGKKAVEITVAAAPEEGKANKAICQSVAKALGVKTAQVGVKTGQTSRLKIIEIVGDPATLCEKIAAWLGKS